jgi:hypothetical protein
MLILAWILVYISLISATTPEIENSALEPARKKAQLSSSGLETIPPSTLILPQYVQQKTLLVAARMHDPVTLANIMISRSDLAILMLKSNDVVIYEKIPKVIEYLMHSDVNIKTFNIIFQYPRLINWESQNNTDSHGILHVMSPKDFEGLCQNLYARIR